MKNLKKIGVENIVTIMDFNLSLGMELKEGFEDDGRLDLGEVIGLTDNLAEIPDVINAFPRVYLEFMDLDEQEKNQIMARFRTKFDLTNDQLEEAIEESCDFGLYAFRYVTRMRRIIKRKAA